MNISGTREREEDVRIGVPTEIKGHEYRVAVTPAGVHSLTGAGHQVVVQSGAGLGSALSDDEYRAAGATILPSAADVWAQADLVCKVKEPLPPEYPLMRENLLLFTYLHSAADLAGTRALLDARVTAVAYETVTAPDGTLPLLAPMSEVAGRIAAQVGAVQLMRPGGRGMLMGGVPGTPPAKVVILGGGTVGRNAAQVAVGMRADVCVVDVSAAVLRAIDTEHLGHVRTAMSNPWEIEPLLLGADLVIGAVLVPGARAPHLVSEELVSRMRPGSVLVDVAIDQGGCSEVSRPTTHDAPTYRVHGTTVYAVTNMPGTVPVTSTRALTNATLPYLHELANVGAEVGSRDPDQSALHPRRAALRAGLRAGLTTHDGVVRNDAVARAHRL